MQKVSNAVLNNDIEWLLHSSIENLRYFKNSDC